MKERDQYLKEFGYVFAPTAEENVITGEIRRQVGQAMAFDPGTERIISRAISQNPQINTNLPRLIVGVGVGLELDFIPKGVSVIGVDNHEGLLTEASKRAERLGYKFTPLKTDAMHLDDRIQVGSLGAIHARLLFQHNPEDFVPNALNTYREKLAPCGFVYAMDLDASTWRMEPECWGFTNIMQAIDTMYERGGRDRNIGNKLAVLLEETGFEIYESDIYEIPDPTKKLHLSTLEGMGKGVVYSNIISPDEFQMNFEEVVKATPEATVHNPTVYQYIASPTHL
ncbi:hypothetical protein A2Z22_05190 [Candidatus Woesebacteria bacterium RBG_16_34_12]|uniref:Methyltransferase domain-containing protein n=1 Tax=Candidatus Woesebacteria bacterium RBG_16_34_12 TaxID=1802480 RepID=A0A1F7XAY8_9BACT|nr:MAG: hypothetical protein A2Z22_05190 [Candidatus Woesebacteria bacterium RBG_16_34_12]